MSSTTITGTSVQDEFNSTVEIATIEIIIDSVIDTVNSDAGTGIPHMSGTSPNKTITVAGIEAAAIKPMIAMKLAARATSGASSSSYNVGPVGVSQSTSSGVNDVNAEQYERAIEKLREEFSGELEAEVA